ncbi:MAG TPA: hypothetical protein VGG72_31085 [Bryobacteraceae bacterium]
MSVCNYLAWNFARHLAPLTHPYNRAAAAALCLGDHLSVLGLLLIEEFRVATTHVAILAGASNPALVRFPSLALSNSTNALDDLHHHSP